MSPYGGGVSQYDHDRNRGSALPSALGTQSYGRIAQVLEIKQRKREALHAQWMGQMPPQPMPAPAGQVRTAAMQEPEQIQRFASVAAIEAAGFKRVAACMYKHGHDIWELRASGDGQYDLVRKREERLVDLRQAAPGTQAAIASGVIARRAQKKDDKEKKPKEDRLKCPQCDGTGAVPHGRCAFCRGKGDLTDKYKNKSGQFDGAPPVEIEVGGPPMGGDMPMDGMDLELGGEPDMIEDVEFALDQAQELYDIHEILHGRDPEYGTPSPVVDAVQDLMNGGDEEGGAGEGESDDGDDNGAPFGGDDGGDGGDEDEGEEKEADSLDAIAARAIRRAKAPPGAKWERMVRDLKSKPGVDNPYAVAWSQYNKSKEAEQHCGADGHGEDGHKCARIRKGMKCLAIHKGAVSEGILIQLLPMADLLADFGHGPCVVAADMVLEPELDLGELEKEAPDEDDEGEEKDASLRAGDSGATRQAHVPDDGVIRITVDDL